MNNHLTKEQVRVLKILSKSDSEYKKIIQNVPQRMLDRWVKQYYQERPVLDDLSNHGIKSSTIWDMDRSNFKEDLFEKAIPLLVNWLKKESLPYHVKASIIHVLIEKPISKNYAFDIIIDIYKSTDPDYRDEWGAKTDLPIMLGNALTRWVDDSRSDVILDLLKNKKFREDTFLIASLANFKKQENIKKAKDVLIKRLQETDLDKGIIITIIMVLRKIEATEARRLIETYLTHSNGEVRSEAKKAIAKFRKL